MPADAVERIVPHQDFIHGQCVIYGIGRMLTIRTEETAWVEGVVLAQEHPTRELFGDAAGDLEHGSTFSLTAESGSVYMTRTAVIARTGVPDRYGKPNLLSAVKIGKNVTGAYIEGTCPREP